MNAPSREPLIHVRQIGKRFGGVVALDNVSLEVAAGSFHAIVGENGAGKSTLMKILSGVLTEFDGEYVLAGRSVRFQSTRDAENAGVTIIHQELNLVEQLSAAANVFLGRERRRGIWLDERAMNQEAARLLGELECHIRPTELVHRLRVGDQQLVEIAKALAIESSVLIMDEPTSALTESEVARLFRVIERLRARGVTILYISHKMDEVFRLADRITVLRDGRLVRTVERGETNPREITHWMVGREIEATRLASRTPEGDLLEVRRLSLPWPDRERGLRLADISFTLRRGEILGIAGLLGAGKTELLECLFGATDEPPSGEILLADRSLRLEHPRDARRAGLALVTEDRKRLGLFDRLSVQENVTLCELGAAATAGLVRPARERLLAGTMVERLSVKTAGLDAPVTSLSGGNQQKAVIGRWLLTRPRVLLLDDPTRGIDVGAKAEIYGLMDALCREGVGIIVTSSELPELLTVSDRILVLCEGRVTGEFSRAEATEQRIMEAATARSPRG